MTVLSNRTIAELLIAYSDDLSEQKAKACRKAARAAYGWPEEAAQLLEEGRSLTELNRVGPWLATVIKGLFAEVPDDPEPPPPLRSDFITFAEARAIVDAHPEWSACLKGDLQMHTTYSDGGDSLAEMAFAAAELGHDYIAITDHSKGLKIAGGMDEAMLAQQGNEIDAMNDVLEREGKSLRVLRSIEMNITPDGEGDMEPEALEALDLVLGSFHSKLRLKEDQTERYVAALDNPHVDVLGHPQGRVFNFRMGLSADWARVFAAAAERDKAVEIDCYPDRQDLRVPLLELAAESGVRISMGTDSHAAWQLERIQIGVAAAILAGIDPERILNFMPREEIVEWARTN
ncbi:MAG TPA: PHP domain-containing protein [Actinomycetota bacterium]|nr:PHP domain-containing protein [Actinomycetota bacterium]